MALPVRPPCLGGGEQALQQPQCVVVVDGRRDRRCEARRMRASVMCSYSRT